MKDLESLDAAFVIDTFLLLLIGIGPKIALVPFLEATAAMPEAVKRRVLRKMLTTAAIVAVLLLVLGGLLTRLLHFSPGALGVASGIILLVIAVAMVLGHQNGNGGDHPVEGRDPMQVAVYPLAVPYLLNPAGIVVLVTLSEQCLRPVDRPGWVYLPGDHLESQAMTGVGAPAGKVQPDAHRSRWRRLGP